MLFRQAWSMQIILEIGLTLTPNSRVVNSGSEAPDVIYNFNPISITSPNAVTSRNQDPWIRTIKGLIPRANFLPFWVPPATHTVSRTGFGLAFRVSGPQQAK